MPMYHISGAPRGVRMGYSGVRTSPARNVRVFLSDAVLEKNYGLMKMDPYCLLALGTTEMQSKVATNGVCVYV